MNTNKNKLIKIVTLIFFVLPAACSLFSPEIAPPEPDAVIIPSLTQPTPPIPQTPQPTELPNTGEQISRLQPGQGVNIAYMDMKDEANGWAIGFLHQSEGLVERIFRTTDGGRTWLDVSPPEESILSKEEGVNRMRVAGFFLDQNTAWVTYHEIDQTFNFRTWHTSDGGQTWELSELVIEEETWDYLGHWQFIDANQGWVMLGGGAAAGSSPVTLLHTIDGGRNWETFFSGSTEGGPLYSGQKTGMHFLNAQTGLITISDPSPKPSVLWTRDGGRTWENQVVIPPENAPAFVADYSCTAGQPHLFSPTSAALIMSCAYTDQDDVYRAQSVIYVTDNGGSSWQILESPRKILDYFNAQVGFSLSQGLLDIPDALQFDKIVSLVWSKPVTKSGEQIHFVNEQIGWMINFESPNYFLSFTTDGGAAWQPLEPTIIDPDS